MALLVWERMTIYSYQFLLTQGQLSESRLWTLLGYFVVMSLWWSLNCFLRWLPAPQRGHTLILRGEPSLWEKKHWFPKGNWEESAQLLWFFLHRLTEGAPKIHLTSGKVTHRTRALIYHFTGDDVDGRVDTLWDSAAKLDAQAQDPCSGALLKMGRNSYELFPFNNIYES